MPQTVAKNGRELRIALDRPDHTYLPGETITGRVSRKSPIIVPSATISISLHARSKSRMVARRGHLTSTYRGRFEVLDPVQHSEKIFEGPLHITIDDREQSWPFSIGIPHHTNLSTLRSLTGPDQSFLSTNMDGIAHQPLPPTFLVERYEYMSGMSAFVEYYLKAELQTASRGSSTTTDAILPFRIIHANAEPLENRSALHLSRHTVALQADSPMVASVEVQTPLVLHIESPVPFLVWAVPSHTLDREDQRRVLHPIRITRIFMNVIAKTEIKCPKGKTVRETDCQTRIDLQAEDAYRRYGESLHIPWKLSTMEQQPAPAPVGPLEHEIASPEALNLGVKIDLHLERSKDLYASFQTFNIRHTHRLKWEMTIEISGTTFELSGEDPITVVGRPEVERSTDWIQPPPEDHLPSFSDYEDSVASGSRRSSHNTVEQSGGVGGLSRLWVF